MDRTSTSWSRRWPRAATARPGSSPTCSAIRELLGGLFLALGLLTPLASAAVIGVMFNAVVGVHWHSGVWAQNGGYELALLFGVSALAVGFTGPGRLSLDRNRSWVHGNVAAGLVALGLGLAGALMVMAVKAV